MFIVLSILNLLWSSRLHRVGKCMTLLSQIIYKTVLCHDCLLEVIDNILLPDFELVNSFLVGSADRDRVTSSELATFLDFMQVILEVIHRFFFCLFFPVVDSCCLLTSFLKVCHCSFVKIFISIMKIVQNAISVHYILKDMLLPAMTNICFPFLAALLV